VEGRSGGSVPRQRPDRTRGRQRGRRKDEFFAAILALIGILTGLAPIILDDQGRPVKRGVVLALLIVAIAAVVGRFLTTPREKRDLLLAALLVLLMVPLVWFSLLIRESGPEVRAVELPDIRILSPKDGGSVPAQIDVAGRSQRLRLEQELWIFTLPSNGTRYYPENRVLVGADGRWLLRGILLGGKEHKGLSYDIFAMVITTNEGRAFLAEYNKCRESGLCLGLESHELPPGVEMRDHIRVKRV